MLHAKLMLSYEIDSLEFIDKWNKGFYNVNGFDKAREDLKELYFLKLTIKNFELLNKIGTINYRFKKGNIRLKEVSLSYRAYKQNLRMCKILEDTLNQICLILQVKDTKWLDEFNNNFDKLKEKYFNSKSYLEENINNDIIRRRWERVSTVTRTRILSMAKNYDTSTVIGVIKFWKDMDNKGYLKDKIKTKKKPKNNLTYIEYLAENLDKSKDYAEYLAENLDNVRENIIKKSEDIKVKVKVIEKQVKTTIDRNYNSLLE